MAKLGRVLLIFHGLALGVGRSTYYLMTAA